MAKADKLPVEKRSDRVNRRASINKKDENYATAFYAELISANAKIDNFNYTSIGVDVISPPVTPNAYLKLIKENSHLQQCINAMNTNVHGFGYRMEFIGKTNDETSEEAQKELLMLEEFFDAPNPDESFHAIRLKAGYDKFSTGDGYIEVLRNRSREIIALYHVNSSTIRITVQDTNPTTVSVKMKRGGTEKVYDVKKRFRRYVQQLSNGERIYFKELGDPRSINKKTGLEDPSVAEGDLATEVIHLGDYNPLSPYGAPQWHTQLPSVLGSREAELTNLDFFENNGIPAMAVLISGGQLTDESFEELDRNFDGVKGRGSTNRVIIVEARGVLEDASVNGGLPVPNMTLKPLYSERQNDALFQEYEQKCSDKIRSAFRLPPVFVGSASDYTYASAKVSLEIAENQIFIPERVLFDDMINKLIVASFNAKYWRFRSNPAALATSEDLIKSIEAFNDSGAISPNSAINIINEKMNLDIPRIEEFWGDLPFKMVEAVLQSSSSPDKLNFVYEVLVMLNGGDKTDIAKPDMTLATQLANKATATSATAKPKVKKLSEDNAEG